MPNSQITKERLKWWEHTQRKLYKQEDLSSSRIKKLEAIPGWYWAIDRKQEVINKAHKVFKRAKERGGLPKQHSKNLQEKLYTKCILIHHVICC